ncbi:MAG: hypothetical protein ABSD20_17675 [Terriglobales bacterium]|jgi:hypothetical protein
MIADEFILLAQPWWVNLLVLIPVLSYPVFRKSGIRIAWSQLILVGIFALAFGFVEAAVVIYIRASIGLLPGFQGTLTDVRQLSTGIYRQPFMVIQIPPALTSIEVMREAATIVMLSAVALLAGKTRIERWAVFLWCFALWDSMYYAGLWITVRWPYSLLVSDVLFLIPVPWVSQVWFPLLVSASAIVAVASANAQSRT